MRGSVSDLPAHKSKVTVDGGRDPRLWKVMVALATSTFHSRPDPEARRGDHEVAVTKSA
jgi:hypothetical protein